MNSLSSWLSPLPLIAVLRGITPAEIDSVGDALVGEGFRILEVPLNSPDPFDSITRLAQRFPACLVGAGTVLASDDIARVAAAGGNLIVMPPGDTPLVREAERPGVGCGPPGAPPPGAVAAL